MAAQASRDASKQSETAHVIDMRTVNSNVRAGQAIFARDVRLKISNVKLPEPIPFTTISLLEEAKNKYRSQIANPEELLASGSQELAMVTPRSEIQKAWIKSGKSGRAPEGTPSERIRAELSAFRKNEAFKVLVLGLCAGLRRGEIDTLQWSQFDFVSNCLWIEITDVHEPKADSTAKNSTGLSHHETFWKMEIKRKE